MLRYMNADFTKRDQRTERMFNAIRTRTGSAPVYFESYAEFWLVRCYAPDLAGRCYFLDFQGNEVGTVNRARILMRDYERAHQRSFHEGTIREWNELKKNHHIYLVPGYFTPDTENPYLDESCYPGFVPKKLDKDLYELVATKGP